MGAQELRWGLIFLSAHGQYIGDILVAGRLDIRVNVMGVGKGKGTMGTCGVGVCGYDGQDW